MRRLIFLTAILMLLSGCTKEVHYDRTVERDYLFYEINSQTPFTGDVVDFFENGQLEYRGTYVDGMLNGPTYRYYENGNQELMSNYIDDVGNGVHEKYHENGQLASRYIELDGRYNGLEKEFQENGLLIQETNWKEGRRHGLNVVYHANGQLAYKMKFQDGKQADGKYETYDNQGQLSVRGFIVNGRLEGVQKLYKNGELKEEKYWQGGKEMELLTLEELEEYSSSPYQVKD